MLTYMASEFNSVIQLSLILDQHYTDESVVYWTVYDDALNN